MRYQFPAGASLLATILCTAAGCTGLPTPPLSQEQAAERPQMATALATETTANTLLLHDGDSRIELRLDRAGALARLGHRHVIITNAVHGTAKVDLPHPHNTQFNAAFRVDTLEVDDPEERAAAGDGFTTVLDAAAISGTREHMLSPVLLDAERFPDIALRLQQLTPESATPDTPADTPAAASNAPQRFLATVVFTVKGMDHTLPVPVQLATLPGGIQVASGNWTVTHAELGLTPYSAAGGLVKVADVIEVRFRLVAKPQ